MSPDNPVPASTKSLLNAVPIESRHPGLQLDKISFARGQEGQKVCLEEVCHTAGDERLLAELLDRRARWLDALSARVIRLKTSSPLTLHLSRASALENAGICLHPIYGFTYLPGSGLKGMARAYAETVWLPAQKDYVAASRKVAEVFGWAKERTGKEEPALASGTLGPGEGVVAEKESGEAGSVVFHDAWPEKWPKLVLDIVNNHHGDYYKGLEAPGDWQEPNMVYFLSVGPGETFSFALSKRNPSVSDECLELAETWLKGALTYLGAGAKTNAGYGCFSVSEEVHADPSPSLEVYETRLKLVSPAFLAGATQGESDCELRGATLRGQLRWWWRTLHAGFVDWQTLRRLETAIWGSDESGGAVRITVEPVQDTIVKEQYDPRSIASGHRLPAPSRGLIQGLKYHSYGMEASRGRASRWYIAPGAQWVVRLIARPGYYSPDSVKDESENGKSRKRAKRAANGTVSGSGGCKILILSPSTVLEQAKAALWLLCRYGGVGAKARKGFGSFEDVPDMNLEKCKQAAMNLRRECGLNDAFSSERAETPSLEETMGFELPTAWDDPWFALDQVGYAVQGFARNHARDLAKKALGLPRRIGSPAHGEFKPVKRIGDRHGSPVLYHLSKDSNGKIMVRVTAFVAKRLPSPEKSKSFLREFLDYLKPELEARAAGGIVPPGSTSTSSLNQTKRAGANGPRAAAPALSPARPAPRSPTGVTPTPDERLVPGDRVEVELLEEKTKKGGWKAKAVVSGKIGPIQNTKDVPGDKKPGERAIVYVHSASSEAVQFLWPTPEVEARFRRRDGGNRPNNRPGNRNR